MEDGFETYQENERFSGGGSEISCTYTKGITLSLNVINKPMSVDRNKLLELNQQGFGATEIATKMVIGRSTVYKLLNEISRL